LSRPFPQSAILKPTAKVFCKSVWSDVRASIEMLKQNEYDAVFDLQGNLKSGLIDYFCRTQYKVGFSKQCVKERINTYFTNFTVDVVQGNVRDDMLAMVKSYFNDKKPFSMPEIILKVEEGEKNKILEMLSHPNLQGKKRFCISPFSAWKNKELGMGELTSFLEKIQRRFDLSFLFLYGSEEERLKALELALHFPKTAIVVDRLSPAALQALMCQLEGVISMDSFPLHLAGTTKTPAFSFFGPSLGACFAPKGAEKAFVQGTCPYGIKFERRCPKLRTCETGACLKQLKAEALAQKFTTWWQAMNY
jgi:heptosyltransferase-1